MTGCGHSDADSDADGEQDEEDGDEDADHTDGDERCNLEPAVIHATTSRHDDWLHRGSLLADLPWLVYHTLVKSTCPRTKSRCPPAHRPQSGGFGIPREK